MAFETIGLQGKYRQLIGDPSVGFSAMVFGLPKSGKSTLCLDFAHYLAQHHGKVLYCAIEEGFGYILQEKVNRLKAAHPRLFVTDRVPETPGQFDFVFIDSVSKAGLEIEDMDTLRKAHPRTSFIFIYHTTKEGRFKGSNTHAHEVDVIIQVEKGRAKGKGRFGVGGEVEV
jgi:predicted ATP-dependent serine protease